MRRLCFGSLAVVALVSACAPHAASDGSEDDALTSRGTYLALGDSIAFGIDPSVPDFHRAADFHGYPEIVGRVAGLDLVNASCPGQSTGGFISPSGQDLGCWKTLRAGYAIHTDWGGRSQLDFALDTIRRAPPKLVTVQIGANDLVATQVECADPKTGCTARSWTGVFDVPGAYRTVSNNVHEILSRLRGAYAGPIVVVNYYSADYGDAFTTQAIRLLNDTLATEAANARATVADVFETFRSESALDQGNACRAGLLAKNPDCATLDERAASYPRDFCTGGLRVDPRDAPCDHHPSRVGQALIAETVLRAAGRAGVTSGANVR